MSVEQYLLLDVLLLPPQKLTKHIIDFEEQACSRPCSRHHRKGLTFFSLRERGNFSKTMSEKRVKNF